VTCSTCSSIYIGETFRDLNITIKEHEDACRLRHTKKSAIAKHCQNFKGTHEINWKDVKFIELENRNFLRKLFEHIYIIQATSPVMNPNTGMKLPHIWNNALPQLPPQ